MVDKDVTIGQLVLQNDLLRSHVLGLEQTLTQLRKEIGQLRSTVTSRRELVAHADSVGVNASGR
jgi:hypothetical protein